MTYHSDQRTYKCPTCHTKYTKIVKSDGTEAIRGNVDVYYTKNAVLQKLCGIEEQDAEKRKKVKTNQYKKSLKKSRQKASANQTREQLTEYDPDLRKSLQQKYATVGFYTSLRKKEEITRMGLSMASGCTRLGRGS